jgi:hypothetical protein
LGGALGFPNWPAELSSTMPLTSSGTSVAVNSVVKPPKLLDQIVKLVSTISTAMSMNSEECPQSEQMLL